MTLTGQTRVKVGGDSAWMRVNRAFNAGSSDFAGTVYLANDSVTGGVPDSIATTLKASVNAAENQTLQSCYTVPDGSRAYLENFCVSNIGGGGADPVTVRLRKKEHGGIGRVQSKVVVAAGAHECEDIGFYTKFSARTFVELTAISTGAASNQDVSGTFRLLLR